MMGIRRFGTQRFRSIIVRYEEETGHDTSGSSAPRGLLRDTLSAVHRACYLPHRRFLPGPHPERNRVAATHSAATRSPVTEAVVVEARILVLRHEDHSRP